MNNQLKFRIWSKKYSLFTHDCMWPSNQRTSEVFLLDGSDGCVRELVSCDGENYFLDLTNHKEDELVVQRWTGLEDEKGKEIYEGDIIEFHHKDESCIRKIVFDDGYFGIYRGENIRHAILEPYKKNCIVIGNIFENPELLKI